ncbi:MAG: peptide-methionine (R)-S-oxide reductase MsrB [Sphingomicrobium sp.]
MTNPTFDRRGLLGALGIGLAAVAVSRGSAAAPRRFPVTLTDAEWRQRLGPERYRILRQAGTERAGTSPLNDEHRRGRFVCTACANPLFASTTKFDSGTGWPSFYRALPGAVVTRGTRNLFFGTEILCARCGGHLGHVFGDGPKPTGLRYCMNGLALRFQPA